MSCQMGATKRQKRPTKALLAVDAAGSAYITG